MKKNHLKEYLGPLTLSFSSHSPMTRSLGFLGASVVVSGTDVVDREKKPQSSNPLAFLAPLSSTPLEGKDFPMIAITQEIRSNTNIW